MLLRSPGTSWYRRGDIAGLSGAASGATASVVLQTALPRIYRIS